jgi:FkbM family methyltransferase
MRFKNLGFIAAGEKSPLASHDCGPEPVTLCKLHHWDGEIAEAVKKGEAVVLYSFRDLRDVAVSAQRQFAVGFDQIWEERWLHDAVATGDKWLALPHVHSAKYEIFTTDLVTEAERLSEFLHLRLDSATIARVAEECSLARLKAAAQANAERMRVTGQPDVRGGNPSRPWLPHEGAVGGWRTELTVAQQELIRQTFSPWLTARGYENSPPPLRDESAKRYLGEMLVPHIGWLKHDPADEVAELLREGHYEADLQAFFWLYLRAGDRVADIGAHFGLYAALAAEVVGAEGRVLAFEPHPQTFAMLGANTARFPQVQCLQTALAQKNGECFLRMPTADLASHSSLSTRASDGVKVAMTRFDELLSQQGWDRVALAKIDTEGSEVQVLEGFGALLGSERASVLSIEFSEANLLAFGRTTRQLGEFIARRGYHLCRFDVDLLQLVPVTEDAWPAWYENFIAVLDVSAVNQRMANAPASSRRIARDVIARAQSCARVKELAHLATYREQASLSASHLEWAQKTETLLAEEREKSAQFKLWAERTEELLAHERANLREITQRAADSTARLKAATTWAEETERLLAEERKLSASHKSWAEETERLLAEERKLSASHKSWAERNDQLLAEARQLAAANQAWAERTEKFLADERAITAELRARLNEMERPHRP